MHVPLLESGSSVLKSKVNSNQKSRVHKPHEVLSARCIRGKCWEARKTRSEGLLEKLYLKRTFTCKPVGNYLGHGFA